MFDAEAWAASTAQPGDVFDEREAARACAFFPRYLRHTKGRHARQIFNLEPWQRSIVRALFGWKRADGSRRFRTLYLEVPRKNGKTQLAAGLGLFCLFSDHEAGAEVYSVATDKDQASIVFNEAGRMRAKCPELRDRSLKNTKAIAVPKTASAWKPMSGDTGNKDGLNASCIIYDEFHAFRDRLLYEVMHTSTGNRSQPLEIITTTAGVDRNGVWWETREHALAVRDGKAEDHELLPVIYAAGKDDDIADPITWATANPNLNITIGADYLAKEAARAKLLPRYENAFKRLHLNIPTEQVERWLPMVEWDAAAPPRPDLAGKPCWGGLDLSSTTDLTALVLVFPDGGDAFDLVCRFWLPAENIDRAEKRDRVPYQAWVREGFLTLTEGNVVDYERIRGEITGLVGAGEPAPLPNGVRPLIETYDLRELAIDRWNATQMSTWLMGDGVSVKAFGQGFASMSSPSKALEKLVLGRTLRHGGNPVLRWMAANAAVQTDAPGNIKPAKDKSTGRIDGIVATVMGLGLATAAAAPAEADVVFG
jgi:phage terminase large subunit-like protein